MSAPTRRGALCVFLAASGALAISACAFEPLHRPGGALGDLRGTVAISGVDGREGYAFRRTLERRFGTAAPNPAYLLEARLNFERRGLAITRDDAVTRFDVSGEAAFALRQTTDGSLVAEGVARALSAYSALATPYATRVAARDAERRVAEDLAERVYAQIAAQLSRSSVK